MRSSLPLLLILTVKLGAQELPPIPADTYELVTEAAPADRAQSLALLNRAKRPMRYHAPMTPPHLLTVSFTAVDAGPGELTELWLSGQSYRWTASLGNYSVSRVNIHGETFNEKTSGLLPMRLHMLRNTVFWAAGNVAADAQFRSASATWKGSPVTCLLVSENHGAAASGPRQWDEAEYCIENSSGLLRVLSFAPGSYSVYSYTKGQSFHGQPLPDRIATYAAGALVIDANLRMDEPGDASLPTAPTPEMIAAGRPAGLQDPSRGVLSLPDARVFGSPHPVIVNAQVGPTGKVLAQEVCASSDPALSAAALELVSGMNFGGSEAQRQMYVEVLFTPKSAISKAMAVAEPSVVRVPVEAYTLERTVTMYDSPNNPGSVETLARRSDGATVRVMSVGPQGLGRFTRELSFPDGKSVMVFDSIEAKVTWPVQDPRFRRSDAPATCVSDPSAHLLRRDKIENQDVEVIERAAGSYRLTVSVAPKLGCENMGVKSEAMRPDGSFKLASETKTTKLAIGEPDPRLFEIAPVLVEMKPSEAHRKLWETIDLHLGPEDKAAFLRDLDRMGRQLDQRYQEKGMQP
jgi:hypothetical protein